ncbi:MAG: NUDIX domain-containing protein [Gammaproteobacteria bacterium]
MKYRFQILEKRLCYEGFFRLEAYRVRHELFKGGWSQVLNRELLQRGHAAALLPYDPNLDCVCMIEQFRIGALEDDATPWLLEFVAGIIEQGETAEQVALREAMEESGLTVLELLPVSVFSLSPGACSERIHLFCGRVDATSAGGVHGVTEEGEDIRVRVIPFSETLALLRANKITSATAIIALQWLALNRDGLRKRWQSR